MIQAILDQGSFSRLTEVSNRTAGCSVQDNFMILLWIGKQ